MGGQRGAGIAAEVVAGGLVGLAGAGVLPGGADDVGVAAVAGRTAPAGPARPRPEVDRCRWRAAPAGRDQARPRLRPAPVGPAGGRRFRRWPTTVGEWTQACENRAGVARACLAWCCLPPGVPLVWGRPRPVARQVGGSRACALSCQQVLRNRRPVGVRGRSAVMRRGVVPGGGADRASNFPRRVTSPCRTAYAAPRNHASFLCRTVELERAPLPMVAIGRSDSIRVADPVDNRMDHCSIDLPEVVAAAR